MTVWCGWRALPRGKKGNNDSLTHRSSPYPRCDPTPDRLVRLCSSGGRARPRQFCLGRVVPERPVLAKQGRVAERRALCGLCRRAGRRWPWALSPVPWMTRAGRPMPDPSQQGWVGGTKSIAVFGRALPCDPVSSISVFFRLGCTPHPWSLLQPVFLHVPPFEWLEQGFSTGRPSHPSAGIRVTCAGFHSPARVSRRLPAGLTVQDRAARH